MKFNWIMVVSIVLLVFAIGAVSAVDKNIADTTQEVLTAEPDDEVLSVDSADELESAQQGNFDELQSLVNGTSSGKTLKLEKDYANGESAEHNIEINNPIALDGQGHTIDAKGISGVFAIKGKFNVVLKNINFVNCAENAVINSYTTTNNLKCENCSFVNCSSLRVGSAIFAGNVYNCLFINCSGSGAIAYGEAYDCSFINCSSKRYGGAIHEGNAYNCSFEDCFAGLTGGAIWMGDAYNCSFIDSHATNSGGAIYLGSAVDCSFRNCSTKDSDAAICEGTVTNCTFVDCQAFAAINSIGADDVGYGNPAKINVFGESNAGYVNVIVNGQTKKVTPSRNGASVSFTDLAIGTYQVKVTYPGSASYNAQTVTSTFRVTKSKPIYRIYTRYPYASSFGHQDAGNVRYEGKNTILYITMDNKNVPGNVNVAINGVSQKVKITGSELSVPLGVLNRGSYNITVSYAGSAFYDAQNKSLAFKIIKGYAISDLRITPDDPFDEADSLIEFIYSESRLHVNLRSTTIPGFITIKVNDLTYVRNITGRSAISLSLGILKPGPYEIDVNYAGSENFEAQNDTIWFDVVKAKPINRINLSPYDFNTYGASTKQINYDGKSTSLNIYLRNNRIAGNVHVTVNGASHKAFAIKGKSYILNIPLGILNLGENVIKVTYAGSAYFDAQKVSFTINVVKGTPIASVEVSNWGVDSDPTIKVKVNNVNGNIWFTVSDEKGNKILTDKIHIENGWAIASVPGLEASKYLLHIYYAGNAHYNAQTIKSSFNVTKISPKLTVAKTTVDGKTVLTANLVEDASGNVTFVVDGSTYKAKITEGAAIIILQDMVPGTYTLKTKYEGDYKYLAETKTRSITIK